MKKIGIDIKILAEQKTGIGNYLENILIHFPEKKFEFFCFSHKKININIVNHNFKFIYSNINSNLGRQVWSQTILPYYIKKYKIDLFWSPSHRIPFLLPKSIKSVVTIHDLVWLHHSKTMRKSSYLLDKYLMPYAIKKSDKILTVSYNTKLDLIENFDVKKNKIRVTKLAPKNHKYLYKDYTNLSKLKNCILLVATNDPRKNINRTIAAYSRLSVSLRKKHNLVIVGSRGWAKKSIKTLIKNFKLIDTVKSIGYIDENKLSWLYKNCKLLILVSIFEGFGLPIVEAMINNKPQITSNNSSMKEVAAKTSFLVNPYSIFDISQKLNLILTNDQVFKKLKSNCMIKIKNFSWRNTSQDTINLFENLLK